MTDPSTQSGLLRQLVREAVRTARAAGMRTWLVVAVLHSIADEIEMETPSGKNGHGPSEDINV